MYVIVCICTLLCAFIWYYMLLGSIRMLLGVIRQLYRAAMTQSLQNGLSWRWRWCLLQKMYISYLYISVHYFLLVKIYEDWFRSGESMWIYIYVNLDLKPKSIEQQWPNLLNLSAAQVLQPIEVLRCPSAVPGVGRKPQITTTTRGA